MSNQIFPSLPGFDIKVSRTPVHSTLIQPAASGKELRAKFQSYGRYRYTLALNFVRQAGFSPHTAYDELATIQRFFAAHMGAWDSFLFTDPGDSSTSGMGFGVGDGTTTSFQLQRAQQGQWTDILGSWPVYTTPRTNVLVRSQDFDLWTANSGLLVVVNKTAAPDGTPTADKLSNSGASQSYASSTTTLALGTQAVASCYMRNIDSVSSILFIRTAVDSGRCVVNWSGASIASVVPSNGATGAGFQDLGNGWYRVWMTFVAAESNPLMRVYPGVTGTNQSIYAWGAQVETGTVPTRYIPTTTSAVTVTPSYWPASGDGFGPVVDLNGSPSIYRTDWQGQQLLYPTPRTNPLINSVWAGGGAAPTSWVQQIATGTSNPTASVFGAAGGATAYYQSATSQRPYLALSGSVAVVPGNYTFSVLIESVFGGLTAADLIGAPTLPAGSIVTFPVCSANPSGGSTGVVTTGILMVNIAITTSGNITQPRCGIGCNGNASGTLQFSRPQIETGTSRTSFIPTTTAAVTTTDYTIAAGVVTFATAPLNGAVLTWTGNYFRRVRFDADELEAERIVSGVWDGKTIKLISVK